MVQDRGLDVYLAPFDNIEGRYLEHAVPTRSSAFTGNPNEVYIEAVNSERFAVVIDLLQDFDVKGGTHLRIIYAIEQSRDNNSRGCYIDLPSLQARAPPGPTVKGRKALIAMDMKVHGAYPSCGFVFSPLKTDERLEMDADEVARDVDMHGKIVVRIQRGHLSRFTPVPCGNYDAPDTEVSSKKVVQDNNASHTVKHVVLGPAGPPHQEDPDLKSWKPIAEDSRKAVKFTIIFRSRDALEKLGIWSKPPMCVDLTVSPPMSPKIKLEDGSDSVTADSATIRGVDDDLRSVNQSLDSNAEHASHGTMIKRERDGSAAHEEEVRNAMQDWADAAADKQNNEKRTKRQKNNSDE